METQRGSALIMALMLLTFLMILGTALLMSVTLDVAIGDNFRSETQLLYLAEAGIAEARALLGLSSSTASQLLQAASGADGVLSGSRDLDTLIDGTDDMPLISAGDRSSGRLVTDPSGLQAGRYFVFLRNDAADGTTNLSDSNQALTLLSVAVSGNSRKVLEVTMMKWHFPKLPASLLLGGTPVLFNPASSSSRISGIDTTGMGVDRRSVGVITAVDRVAVLSSIPDLTEFQYPGIGNPSPPPADVAVIDTLLDPRLRSPASIERVVDRIVESASEKYSPGWSGSTLIGNTGTGSDYRVVVVNGDCILGSGTGFGILLVRGNVRMTGTFHWNGLILAIGQGSVTSSGTVSGIITGGLFVMRTRADDRSSSNESGTMLAAPGSVEVNFSGSGNSIQIENPGAAALELVNQKFPYVPIAIREY